MKKTQPVVLIVTKDTGSRGGVASYFNLFFRRFDDPAIRIERFDIGSRSKDYYKRERRRWGYCLDYAWDLCRFVWALCRRREVRIVHLNPSLIPVPLLRDGMLLLITKLFRRKAVVFFRGWRDDIARRIGRSRWRRWIFASVFRRADAVVVLADDFRRQLTDLGIQEQRIEVSRTMFDGDCIQPRPSRSNGCIRFLYLSRISREKGAFDLIEAAGKLKQRDFAFTLAIHGHGATADTIPQLRARAEALDLHDYIEWGDYIDGVAKYAAYAQADVFVLPSHHEGCPNSVLEAMASGCFVISTGVGALGEVVQDGVNGLIVQPKDAEDLASKMRWTIENLQEVRRRGAENRFYAEQFESQKIVGQVAGIYRGLLEGDKR